MFCRIQLVNQRWSGCWNICKMFISHLVMLKASTLRHKKCLKRTKQIWLNNTFQLIKFGFNIFSSLVILFGHQFFSSFGRREAFINVARCQHPFSTHSMRRPEYRTTPNRAMWSALCHFSVPILWTTSVISVFIRIVRI